MSTRMKSVSAAPATTHSRRQPAATPSTTKAAAKGSTRRTTAAPAQAATPRTRKAAAKAAPTAAAAPAAPSRRTTAAAHTAKARATAPTTPQATATHAKRAAVAKAQAIAPHVAARIGSTPHNTFRGNPDIFGRLVEDHDRHRALLAMITETRGDSTERQKLFKELTKELKSHAAAEEQALWSSVMRNPKTTDDARHAVGEHKEIDKMLDDLAARDMASSGWLRRFAGLREEYLHHIQEEEQEQFVAAQKHLTPADIRYMKQVFNRRKATEKTAAKVTPKLRKKAH